MDGSTSPRVKHDFLSQLSPFVDLLACSTGAVNDHISLNVWSSHRVPSDL